jgi:cysteinyl-tRNA synthetase
MLLEEAVLKQCNAQQLCLLFLLNAYQSSLIITKQKLNEVQDYNDMMVEFFKDFEEKFNMMVVTQAISRYQKLTEDDLIFDQRISSIKKRNSSFNV